MTTRTSATSAVRAPAAKGTLVRAIWKGAVAFGLVNVPVKLYAATGEQDVPLHQVHREDGGRIRYKKVCSVDGEPVEMRDIAKGYQTDDGKLVVLTDEDMAELPLATEREISVMEFVPAEQVDPIMLSKTYYLEPDKTAAKPYALLREALAATDRMAVVKVALRQRESMAVLRVRDDVICLQTLLWPDEIRAADFPILDNEVTVRPQELTMASSLVESLSGDFDPSDFHDSYREALETLIQAKVETGSTQNVPAPAGAADEEGGGEVIDLLSALQRSVEKARGSRGAAAAAEEPAASAAADDADAATADEAPAAKPARKRAATKAAADEEPAEKAPAKPARKRAAAAAAEPTQPAETDEDAEEAPAKPARSTRASASRNGAQAPTARSSRVKIEEEAPARAKPATRSGAKAGGAKAGTTTRTAAAKATGSATTATKTAAKSAAAKDEPAKTASRRRAS
jgi:DNA end-binding protein Ku